MLALVVAGLLWDLVFAVAMILSALLWPLGMFAVGLAWLFMLLVGFKLIGPVSQTVWSSVNRSQSARSRLTFDEQKRRHGKWGGTNRFRLVIALAFLLLLWPLLGIHAWHNAMQIIVGEAYLGPITSIFFFATYSALVLYALLSPVLIRLFPRWWADRRTNRELSQPAAQQLKQNWPNPN